jgi:carotenoid 1,2-hydratase
VALYRPGRGRWALTEQGRSALSRDHDHLHIGSSALELNNDALHIDVHERCFPTPQSLRGYVRVIPEVQGDSAFELEAEGGHHWWPIAPRARVEVRFDKPRVRWSGTGYFDSNWGARPLQQDFASWSWSRAPLSKGAAVTYDVLPRTGPRSAMGLRFADDGTSTPFALPPEVKLPPGMFGIERAARSEGPASVHRTLTDAHFYVRSSVRARLCGEDTLGVHEALSLDRFDTTWAKLMVPFRMPRVAR